MELQKEIEKYKANIHIESYSISIGEWISLYRNNDLDIHPESERFARWSNEEKTRFIEAILLGIPQPPILVWQRSDGVWDVIDGLQRLATIYQFVGILKDKEGNLVEPFVLGKSKQLLSLEGTNWTSADQTQKTFTIFQKILLKQAELPVNLILSSSQKLPEYDLWQLLTDDSTRFKNEPRQQILTPTS